VFLCDQDDVWMPEKIEDVALAARSNPDAFAFMNDAHVTDEKLARLGVTRLGQVRDTGAGDSGFVTGCCSAFRSDYLRCFLPVPKGLGHDFWLVTPATMLGRRVLIDKPLQLYRRHSRAETFTTYSRVHPNGKVQALTRSVVALFKLRNRSRPTRDLLESYKVACLALGELRQQHNLCSDLNLWQLEGQFGGLADRLEVRLRLRDLPLLTRVFSVAKLYLARGFYDKPRLLSAIRDAVGEL
jgi:hypothetical protein